MKNPVNFFEIPSTDLERARQFYSDVFGIALNPIEMPGNKMYMFEGNGNQPNAMGALICTEHDKPSTDGVVIYFECEDLAVEEAKVEKAGGKVIMPKMAIGEFGFIAQFIDTEGNRIGLHSAAK